MAKKLTQKQQADAEAKAAGQGDMWPDFHGDQWYEAKDLPRYQISNQQLSN